MRRISMITSFLAAAVVGTGTWNSAIAQSGEGQKVNMVAVERLSNEFLNQGKLDVVDAVYVKNAIHHSPMGDLNLEARKMTRTALGMAMPDFQVQVQSLTANNDWVSVLYTFTGTFTGQLPTPDGKQVPGNNAKIKLYIGSFFHFDKSSLITESWETFDNLSLSMQMGLLSVPR